MTKSGIELKRVGAPENPVEGSNVTLICTTSIVQLPYMPTRKYHGIRQLPQQSNSNRLEATEKFHEQQTPGLNIIHCCQISVVSDYNFIN